MTWIVDLRHSVAQQVQPDALTPPSEGGRFVKIEAPSAKQAIDIARERRK